MEMIKALLDEVLLIKCVSRDYFFQLRSAAECERWATNLVQLAQCAGFNVPGYVVMPPEEGLPADGLEAVKEPPPSDTPADATVEVTKA